MMKIGYAGFLATTGEPHSGQKPRLTSRPLSAVLVWYFGSRVSRSAPSGTNNPDV